MEPLRHAWLAPPIVVLAVVGGLMGSAAPRIVAGSPGWDPPSCATAGPGSPGGAAWFRTDERLDARGSLVGYRLTIGTLGTDGIRQLDLAPESFATGPWDELVLIGTDDGRSSRLRLIDAAAGCATEVGIARDVVRSALLDGDAVVEHRVDRRTRADLGVWRRPLDGSAARRILDPLPADARYGPTFTTDLGIDADGTVAATACGASRCRARVADRAGGVTSIDDVGAMIGLARDTFIAHRPCAALPCPVEAVALADGSRRLLLEAAGVAVQEGAIVVAERGAREGGDLIALDVETGDVRVLAAPPGGLGLLPRGVHARAGVAHRDGWAVLVGDAAFGPEALAIDARSGDIAPVAEVLP